MQEKKDHSPKRRDRYHRIVVDYADAQFHQNEEILKILKEIRDLLKHNSK